MQTESNTALTIYIGEGDDGAAAWTSLALGERKRLAMAALHDRDEATLQSLSEAWTRTFGRAGANVSHSTIRNYRTGIRQLLDAWRHEDLIHPSPDAAALWVRGMERRGLKPLTIQARVAAGRNLYASIRWATQSHFDPFADLHIPTDKTPPWEKRQPYYADELDALLIAATDPFDKILVLLGSHAGLRAKECCDLCWNEVDLGQRRLVVLCGKGRKRRGVSMSKSLVDALRLAPRCASDDYVLPYGKPISAWRRMKWLCEKAGVKAKGVHSLRHSAGTRVYQETSDLEAAARHLGHQSIETTRVYAKWSDTTLKNTVSNW